MLFALALPALAALAAAPLDDARALLDDKRPTEALALVEEIVAQGGLDEGELLAAYEILGRANGMLGRGQQAQRAFEIALRVSPGFELGDVVDPEVRGPYQAARAGLPPVEQALFARVTTTERDERAGLLIELVADDKELVAAARVSLDGGALAELPLSSGAREVLYPLDPRKVTGELAVVLVDESGNALARLPVDKSVVLEPLPEQPAAPGELRWLSLGGATALFLGIVGVSAAGVWFAAADGGEIMPPEGARDVGLAGVGLATAVIAIGGALVVTDFVLAGR